MPVPGRLVWRCRRGMREMDILCTRFVEAVYDDLSEPEHAVLERLLDCPDQDILAWFHAGDGPDDPELAEMMHRMRELAGKPPE